jgi:hypothetical protein
MTPAQVANVAHIHAEYLLEARRFVSCIVEGGVRFWRTA